jgi:hypothetical protein
MTLSRKREKELKRLREAASDLWDDQREILEHATKVVREASRQAGYLGREEVAPRVKDAIDNRVRPGIATGLAATRTVAEGARERLSHDLLPGVASALSSALAVLEIAKDPRVREALGKASKAGTQLASRAGAVPTRKSSGVGRYILVGIGVVAAVGVAYAAWQTLRADDELWVSDEPDDVDEPAAT